MSGLSRREFLAGVGACGAAMANAQRTPNVLFIMTDQHRFDALSCAGHSILHTPHLDRLAAEGVRFTNAVCSSPLCGPSRASMLSGQYQHGHRCPGNAEIAQPGMPESVDTWDELLSRAGYRAEYHGKWHTGSANRAHYSDGLPYYLKLYHEYLAGKYGDRKPVDGEATDRYTHWPYKYVSVDRMMLKATKAGLDMPHHNEAGEHLAPAEDSLTAWTVQRAMRFLKSKPTEPFTLTCSILHPHAPLTVSRPYFDIFDPAKMPMPPLVEDAFAKPEKAAIPNVLTRTPEGLGTFISLYYGLVKEVDDWVGKLLGALDESGLADNTLVVFTSDHGEMLGEHNRVSKMVFYEASVRVPLIVRFPGRIPKKRTIATPVSGADLAPTILDYAGVAVPSSMHGRSLRRVIEGKRPQFDYAYSEVGPKPGGQRIVRTTEWKFAFKGGQPFLYNLRADAGEARNLLAPEHRTGRSVEQARSLKQMLLNRCEEMRSPELDAISAFAI